MSAYKLSAYQLYEKYKETPKIKEIYKQINDLSSLLANYNVNSHNSKLKEINTKAKELYQQYRNFNNLKMHIQQLLIFMTNHTQEFKQMQRDFFEIKQLIQQSQTGDIIHMNVAVTTPHGNLTEKLLKITDTRKRRLPSANDSNKKPKAEGKTKRRKRRKGPKKKKLETTKKIDFKKLRKHITQRLKPRSKFKRSKARNKK